MADHARRYLDSLAPRANASMQDNARECIHALLPSGLCSADRLAKHLDVGRRTLHRYLARDGETFSTLVDSVRSELAIRYIHNRERPLASVVELLGFSVLSAFSRWFRWPPVPFGRARAAGRGRAWCCPRCFARCRA